MAKVKILFKGMQYTKNLQSFLKVNHPITLKYFEVKIMRELTYLFGGLFVHMWQRLFDVKIVVPMSIISKFDIEPMFGC